MPRKPIQIGPRCFPTKKAAKNFYRDIRDAYPEDGLRISDEHAEELIEMVAYHHEADDKIGCGIDYFRVETDSEWGTTRHFMIHRKDGSSTDVSFLAAIDGRNTRSDRLEAMRQAIADQVQNFKARMYQDTEFVKCALTGEDVAAEDCHIDHCSPDTFITLVNKWVKLWGGDLSDVKITPPADNQVTTLMTDVDQVKSWSEFHRKYAKLRVLSKRANLSDARKGT